MATATIQVAYEAETTSLKATVNEINQINDKVVQGAQESASKVKKEYTGIANSFAAAFSGGEVKKALDNQAKAIDNVGKSGKSLTGQLRGLKGELAALEIAGQEGTAAFNQLLIAASKLEDQIGDTRARVKILASDTFKFDAAVGATQALASGFEVAQGAAALFGSESEDLQKAIVKITAATAVANGVNQLAALIKEENALKTGIETAALTTYTFVTNGATLATKLWRAALVATGIGALIAIIGTLASSFLSTSEATDEAAESARNYQNAIDELNKSTQESGVKAGNAQIALLQKQNKISDETAKKLIVFNELQTDLSNAATDAKAKEAEAYKRFEEEKAKDLKDFGIVTKTTQNQLFNDLKAIEEKRVNTEKELRTQSKLAIIEIAEDTANKQKELAKKASDEQAKILENEAKAREQLAAGELKLFESQLSAEDKIRSDSNNEVIELEKQFAAARFKAGSDEEIVATQNLTNAIAVIRENANNQIAALDKATNEKLLAERLEAAKAAEGATLAQQLTALENQQKIELAAAESVGAKEADIKKKYAGQIAAIKVSIADQTLNDEINKLKTLEITEGSTLERREALIRAEGAKRVKAAGDDAEAIKLINAETDQAITDENKKETDKRIDAAFEYAAAVTSVFSQLNELSKIASEQRIADITLQSEKELEAINASSELERDKERQRVALAKRTAAAISAEKTQQAKQDKALALFEIGVNTAKGIISALGSTPPNPALALLIGIAGAAQLAAVAAKPIPKFERGGVVGGRLHSGGGTMVEAERDEYIVNRRQSMRHRSELDAINSSSDAFRKLIEQRYVRPALMNYVAGNRNKQGVTVNASLNSKSMEKEMRGMRKDLSKRNMTININQQDSRYLWQ
jgi:hypothetical protein